MTRLFFSPAFLMFLAGAVLQAGPAWAAEAARGGAQLPMVLALLAALLASGAALIGQRAAARAQHRLFLRQDLHQQEFGRCLMQAAQDIAELGARQARMAEKMQAQAADLGATASRAGAAAADTVARLSRVAQRLETVLAVGSVDLDRARQRMSPLAGALKDLPATVTSAVGNAAVDAAAAATQLLAGQTADMLAQLNLAASAVQENSAALRALPDLADLAGAADRAAETLRRADGMMRFSDQAARAIAAGAQALADRAQAGPMLTPLAGELADMSASLRRDRARAAELAAMLARLGAHIEARAAVIGPDAAAPVLAAQAIAAQEQAASRTRMAAQGVERAALEAPPLVRAETQKALAAAAQALLTASAETAAPAPVLRSLEHAVAALQDSPAPRAAA